MEKTMVKGTAKRMAITTGVLLLMLIAFSGVASAETYSGTCGAEGADVQWSLDESSGVLTISGSGEMADYSSGNVPWNSYKNSIKTVVVENGVTSIGTYAFYSCSALKNITIPNSVTSIGDAAFRGCSSLGSITVASANQYFSSDSEGVLFNKDKTVLKQYPAGNFATSYNIPDSVTRIGDFAFFDCRRLSSITIGNSVTSIGNGAFNSCSSLSSITIPDRVTSIGWGAFYDCIRLSRVYFCGAAPGTFGSYVFSYCASDFTIYYIEGKSGWTTPGWKGYNTKTWDPYVSPLLDNITAEKYAIIVENSSGKFVENATVTWDGHTEAGSQTAVTDKNGIVTFPMNTDGEPLITVSCSSYHDYTNQDTNYHKNTNRYDVITLYNDQESAYKLGSACYIALINGSENSLSRQDVLSGTKRLSLSNSKEQFNLYCRAISPSTAVSYELMQDKTVIASSASGDFSSLKVGSFVKDKKVFVRVTATDKSQVDTYINLLFVDDKAQEDTSLKFGRKLEFTVASDTPFIGGSKLSFDIPDMPLEFYISGDTVHLGVNTVLAATKEEKPIEEQIDKLRKTIAEIKRLAGAPVSKTLQGNINYFMKDKNKAAKWGPVDASLSVIGYGESKLDASGETEITVYFCLMGSVSNTLQGPTVVVGVIPVTYSIKLSADGKLIADFNFKTVAQTYNGDVTFTVTPKLEAFGGVGIGKVVGAGAYGSAEMPFEFQLIGTTVAPGLNYVDLTGELGLKAYAGIFEYKRAFLYHTWHIYTRTGTASLQNADDEASWLSGLYDPAAYEQADISYLKNQSDWLGAGKVSPAEADASNELYELQTSAYRNMQPVIGQANGVPVMVWVRANSERDSFNYPQLVYAVYKDETWSEPAAVDAANTTADAAPVLYTMPDGTLWLAYQNTAAALTADSGLPGYAAAQTIVAARFDAAAGSFTDFTTLSADGVFSRTPVLTAVNGAPLVLWTTNSDSSDYFGANESNNVCYSQYGAGGWSSAVTLASGLNAVTQTAVGSLNGTLAAAVITDGDNNLATANDRTLTLYSGLNGQSTAGTEIASGSVSAAAFAVLPGDSSSSLLWSDGTALQQYNGESTSQVLTNGSLSNGFTVLADRIIYNGANSAGASESIAAASESAAGENAAAAGENGGTKGGSNLFAITHDSTNGWNEAVQITNRQQYLQAYSAVEINNLIYLAAVQTAVTIEEDNVIDDCTLSWTILHSIVDVAVSAVSADHNAEAPGAEVPVSVDLLNNGDSTINEVTVSINDGSSTVASQSFNVALAAGAEKTVELAVPLGTAVTPTEYTVTVTTAADSNSSNNTAALTIGYSDLVVSAELLQSGSKRSVLINVTNRGAAASAGSLSLNAGTAAVAAVSIESLARGESTLIEVELTGDLQKQLVDAGTDILTAAVAADAEELDEFNNTAQLFIEPLSSDGPTAGSFSLNADSLTCSLNDAGDKYEVQAELLVADSNELASVYVVYGVYDAAGRLLEIKSATVAVTNGQTAALSQELAAAETAAQIKIFVLDSNVSCRPLCAEGNISVKG